MVDFELIRTTLVEGLSSFIGMPVIESDTAAEMPPYPFLTYNVTTSGISTGYPGMTILVDLDDDTVTEQYIDQPIMMVSINSYAIRKTVSIQNAMRAADWLNTTGHDVLKSKANTVVVDIGDIQSRDVQLGDEWERRNGFDVTLRASSVIEVKQDWIEKANMQRS